MPPRVGPREQEIGDVGARDEQDQHDDDHDCRERLLITPAQPRTACRGRNEGEGVLEIRLLVLFRPVLRHRDFADLGLQAAERRRCGIGVLARLQAEHDAQPPIRPAVERAFLAAHQRFGAERNGHVERPADFGAEELGRHHADDRVGHAFDHQRLAEDIDITAEAALPEVVADDRHRAVRATAPPVVLRREGSAEDRRNAQDIEEGAARPDPIDHFRLPALGEIEPGRGPCHRAVECLLAFADRLPDRIRPRAPIEQDEPLWFLNGQRAQDEAVED